MKTTKHLANYVTRMVGVAGLASVSLVLPVVAIEKPTIEEAPEENNKPIRKAEKKQVPEQKEQVKDIAWIGLGGSPVSEILSKHLKLDPEQGLTLFHIIQKSPAQKSGLKVHDIITEFDGKKIGSMEDLKNAVTSKNPGDEALVKFIHEGEAQEKKIILGSRKELHQHKLPNEGNDPLWQGMGHLPKVERDRLEQLMLEHMNEMKNSLKGPDGIQLDMKMIPEEARGEIEKMLNEPGGLKLRIRRSQAEAAEMLKKLKAKEGGGAFNEAIIKSLERSIKSIDESMKRLDQVDKLLGNEGGWKFDMQGLLGKLDLDKPKDAPKDRAMKFDFNAQASITRMDSEGSVTIKTINSNKEVIVKDKSGKVVFEGPYQTEQDKAAVPDKFKHRIDGFTPHFPKVRKQLPE